MARSSPSSPSRSRSSSVGAFPSNWDIELAETINDVQRWVQRNRRSHPLFTWLLQPFSDVVDWAITSLTDLLVWLPWFVLPVFVAVLIGRTGRWISAIVCAVGVLYLGAVGYWDESMQTLALMLVAVIVSLLIGIPLGVLAALRPGVDRVIRPILDAMQTVPGTVYLVPAALLFGIGVVPAAAATIIYALPPAVRLTTLGIRGVPANTVEAGQIFGSTRRQLLTKVQLPQALPSIAAGVNQTIMMALGIVVLAGLIGAGGLGQEVISTLRLRSPGRGMIVGLAIVVVALVLDRASQSFIGGHEQTIGGGRGRLSHRQVLIGLGALVAAAIVGRLAGVVELPVRWGNTFADPVDDLVIWVRDTFRGITGAFNDFMVRDVFIRGRDFLLESVAWPVLVIASGALAWVVSGWKLALFTVAGVLLTGLIGMWALAIETLVQVIVAVIVAVAIAVPVGVWIGRRPKAEAAIGPVLDALQTIPPLIYAVPFVMIFSISVVPGGLIASVLYAIPPGIRVTALGIKQVSPTTIEAATTFGATERQLLWGVRLPLALPAIVLAVNQVIMMVLAMVIIAGMTGAGALGFKAVEALTKPDTGLGVEVGVAVVVMAMILDRLTQAFARRLQPPTA